MMVKRIIISTLLAVSVLFIFEACNKVTFGSEILNPNLTYEIYSSEQIVPTIKLNTRNGLMTQLELIQGEMKETPINTEPLVAGEEEQNGRFGLYPGSAIYHNQFILIDRITGTCWHVVGGGYMNPHKNKVIKV